MDNFNSPVISEASINTSGRFFCTDKKYSFALPENIYANICQSAKTQQAVEMTAKNVQEILQDFGNSRKKRKYKCVSNVYIINFILKLIHLMCLDHFKISNPKSY